MRSGGWKRCGSKSLKNYLMQTVEDLSSLKATKATAHSFKHTPMNRPIWELLTIPPYSYQWRGTQHQLTSTESLVLFMVVLNMEIFSSFWAYICFLNSQNQIMK